ncbi:MAG: hypothetical protein II388_00995 [Clostridia bacterium]|nr:hypothetical protein [Clostridia bacterium]
MALSKETVLQIIACHAKGMTVREIAKKAGLEAAQVEVCLQDHGKKPNYSKRKEKGKHLSADKKTEVIALLKEGKGITEVSKITEVNIKTVGYYKSKLDKEKEPATAATVTSSMDVKQIESSGTVSASKYTIAVRKSQAQRALDITKKTLKDIYEYMNEAEQRAFDLGDEFGRICTAIEEEEE